MRQCLLRLDGTPEHRVTEQKWCATSVKVRGTWLGIVQPVIRQRENPEKRVGTVEVWATTLASAEHLFV